MVGTAHRIPLEVVKAVLEVSEVAWSALEHRRESKIAAAEAGAEEACLRAENIRLRAALGDNLALLRGLVQTPALAVDCPSDLYTRLVAAADSSSFLNKLESLNQESTPTPNGISPFKEATVFGAVDIVINLDHGEPSWWVWVPQEMVPDNLEEVSGIDDENYVIINEESVVDGIADFIAKCILANPKSKMLTPEELRKSVTRALVGIKDRSMLRKVWEAGQIIYALSTCGIALAELYRHRAVLQAAATGVHHTSKLVMKAL